MMHRDDDRVLGSFLGKRLFERAHLAFACFVIIKAGAHLHEYGRENPLRIRFP